MENKIEFRTQTNQIQDSWVMRITSDRRIEVNEDVEVTEAAHKVLEALQHMLTPQRKPLTDEDYVNACMSYRHDFGLMTQEQRDKLMFQAREWARAFGMNESAHGIKE